MHASMTFFLPTFIKLETGNLWLAGACLTIFEGAGAIGILAAGRYVSERILNVVPKLDLSNFRPERILENKPLSERGLV
ncbi:MAG: hypothetical protein JRC58_08885 [Deltaproteobacteria bacterium]|nr:hypothetical protein [Deltaproteobacteria bacterium]